MATVRHGKIHIPIETTADGTFDYVKFTLSGSNTEYKVCETTAYIFGSPVTSSPFQLEWTYITAGVVSCTRSKVRSKRSYEWAINFHVHFVRFGLPAYTTRLEYDCQYTHVGKEFHLFSLPSNRGILGIQFQYPQQARTFRKTIEEWLKEGPEPFIPFRQSKMNPPLANTGKSKISISEPIKCEPAMEGTRTLSPEDIKMYLEAQEKIAKGIDVLKRPVQKKKVREFPLYYSVAPTTVLVGKGHESPDDEGKKEKKEEKELEQCTVPSYYRPYSRFTALLSK